MGKAEVGTPGGTCHRGSQTPGSYLGVVFGYFQARRAAQMDPIEALRHA